MRKLGAVAGLILPAMLITVASAAPVCRSELTGVNDRCPVWTGSYNHPEGRGGNGEDIGRAIALSPSGDRIYATGQSRDDATAQDQAVVALNAATGQRVWSSRYETAQFDTGSAITATSSSVFVTGRSGPAENLDWVTSAYDADTGQQRWVQTYGGPKRRDDTPYGIGASPDGSIVYVTGGIDDGANVPGDIRTVAYDASDGTELWSSTYDNGGYDGSFGLQVSPDGATVFVAGQSRAATSDAVVLAYSGGREAGQLLWTARLDRGGRVEFPEGLALSADGRRVALTATSRTTLSDGEYVTAVFDAASGAELWRAVHNGSRVGDDVAGGVVIAGDVVVVTGKSAEQPAGSDYGTIAYDLETGAVRWSRLANSAAHFADSALDIAASPDGENVYVTGYTVVPRGEIQPVFKIEPGTAMTVAYDADSGERRWVAHHNESGVGADVAVDVEAGSDRIYLGGTFVFSGVYVYPTAEAKAYAYDFGVVAYPA